jgi:hypothetical protein
MTARCAPRCRLVIPALSFVLGAGVALSFAAQQGGAPSKPAAPALGEAADDPSNAAIQADIQKAMAAAAKFVQPGEHHKALERFLGSWTTTTTTMFMGRRQAGETGTASGAWLIPGRWLKLDYELSMAGMRFTGVTIIGYDNFKMSYVATTVTSADTAMVRYEGDMDPSGDALIMYGTLDEYITGEHDKMVKYLWRFTNDNRIVLEVHDLPIGERNTQVIEVAFDRVAGEKKTGS